MQELNHISFIQPSEILLVKLTETHIKYVNFICEGGFCLGFLLNKLMKIWSLKYLVQKYRNLMCFNDKIMSSFNPNYYNYLISVLIIN